MKKYEDSFIIMYCWICVNYKIYSEASSVKVEAIIRGNTSQKKQKRCPSVRLSITWIFMIFTP